MNLQVEANRLHKKKIDYKQNNSLALKAKAGDTNAKELLIENNSNLIHSLANRYKQDNYSEEDLYQDGVIGMIRALDTYDPDRSSFITHAHFWIKSEMWDRITKINSTIYSPVNFKNKVRKYNQLKNDLDKAEYSCEELEEYGLNQQDVENVEKYGGKTFLSIESLTESGLMDTLGADSEYYSSKDDLVEHTVIHKTMTELLLTELEHKLKPFEAMVLKKYFGIGVQTTSLSDIAKEHGVTRQYISKVKLRGLNKLKESKELKSFI